jgi:hypothetical protein
MNNENNLSDALAKNGSFDASRANEIRAAALGSFDAKLRKVDRWLMVHMCLCCWLIVFTLFSLLHSTTTKSIVIYGLLLLIFFETTILMKLWYWMMNNKISVLKSLKEMQLGQTADGSGAGPGESDTLRGPLTGISRRERAVWWIVLAAGAGAIGAIKGSEVPWSYGNSLVHNGVVTLAADGSGSAETDLSVLNGGFDSLSHFSFHMPEGAKVRVLDSDGEELPLTISPSPQNGHVRYDVNLPFPVMPGRRLDFTRVATGEQWAKQDQGTWTYTSDDMYGYDTTDFTQTVVLPPGAEVVSATPWPATVFTLGDRTAVRFEAVRGRNDRFKFTVQYRLPAGG